MRKEILLTLILLVIAASAIILGSSVEYYNPALAIAAQARANVVPDRSFVYVFNGTNRQGLAARTTELLRTRGFDAHSKGNARARTYTRTLVISRNGKMEQARAVAEVLGVRTPFFLISDTETTNEITVIVGDDFRDR
ncbi:MAG: LytR C-terminal domain-containing protein [Chitinivibrionia bacterium]|jgi:hypothetical protein|nr:LytR C-terminal domain-containing protein [Chitinivibrionia bacterium]